MPQQLSEGILELTVRLKVPIESHRVVSAPGFAFIRWIAQNDEEAIVAGQGTMAAKLYFDLSCVLHPADSTNIEKLQNVFAHQVIVDISIREVSEELGEFILRLDWRHQGTGPTQDEYLALGRDVYNFGLTLVNRMIRYARTAKGQYWLAEWPINIDHMSSDLTHFDAMVTADGEKWVRWHPTHTDSMVVVLGDESRYVERNEWEDLRWFVTSERSTNLVQEILAGAELLAALGYSRSALTEAVSALEVAVEHFFNSPVPEKLATPDLKGRIDNRSLRTASQRLGLTVTVGVLLPILIGEEKVPTHVFRGCSEAIAQRQNVTHSGSREAAGVGYFLRSIRDLCGTLRVLTTENAEESDG